MTSKVSRIPVPRVPEPNLSRPFASILHDGEYRPTEEAHAAQAGEVPHATTARRRVVVATNYYFTAIALIFYTMVKKQVEYDATFWAQRDAECE